MNNKVFIAELSQAMGFTAKDTQHMVLQLIDAMADHFQEGTTVSIQNFGNFEVKKKLERVMISPNTGQRMLVPPKLVLGFRISPTWKEQLKNGGGE